MNATSNGSSTNHLDSEKDSKKHTSNKTDTSKVDMSHHDQVSYAAMMSHTCDIAVFDEQSLLWTLQTAQRLEQHPSNILPSRAHAQD